MKRKLIFVALGVALRGAFAQEEANTGQSLTPAAPAQVLPSPWANRPCPPTARGQRRATGSGSIHSRTVGSGYLTERSTPTSPATMTPLRTPTNTCIGQPQLLWVAAPWVWGWGPAPYSEPGVLDISPRYHGAGFVHPHLARTATACTATAPPVQRTASMGTRTTAVKASMAVEAHGGGGGFHGGGGGHR